VEVEKSGRRIVDLDMWVGGDSRDAARTDLGAVGTREAADYLLALARRTDGDFADEAIGAASLAADVVIWPELLDMARDESIDTDTREGAIFWLAQLAGDRATEGLEEILRSDGDTDVKEAALFGLSQLPDGAGFDALMNVARDGDDPELVQASLFWLGQTGDPRAISLFEEILARD
jgi:HEAT repeat protein